MGAATEDIQRAWVGGGAGGGCVRGCDVDESLLKGGKHELVT